MAYDPQKHHRRSIRLKDYDYTREGAYFVTICVQDRACLFGDVADGDMRPNVAGEMVERVWYELPKRFEMVQVNVFVVMPNHIHGIVVIDGEMDANVGADLVPAQDTAQYSSEATTTERATTERATTERATTRVAPTDGRDLRPRLGDIVGAFKSLTTHQYTRGVYDEGWSPFRGRLWQRNYWERIIRNEREYLAICDYIVHNPAAWINDQLHPKAPPNRFNR